MRTLNAGLIAPPDTCKPQVCAAKACSTALPPINVITNISSNPLPNTVIFEGFVGGATITSGTDNVMTGFTEGSIELTLADFAGVRVEVQRGGQDLPQIGGFSFSKDLASDTIVFGWALELDEYVKIKTIPA